MYHFVIVQVGGPSPSSAFRLSVAWNVLKFLTPGLADAAAAIHPLEERPDGGGFLKRKRADDTGGGSNKSKEGGIGGRGAGRRGDIGGSSGGAALKSEFSLSRLTCQTHGPPSQLAPSPSTKSRPGNTMGLPGSSTGGPARMSPRWGTRVYGRKVTTTRRGCAVQHWDVRIYGVSRRLGSYSRMTTGRHEAHK
jgi:hypothetical protein